MERNSHERMDRRKFVALATIAGCAAPSILKAQSLGFGPRGTSRDRLEQALARIADPKGEGKRACLTVYTSAARAAADAADARARAGISLGPIDGAIVSIKDLFDVAGEPTRAGSKILANAPPAKVDAVIVRRLRAAGAVIVAKTNMVEFAFTISGLNPHYGTPGNPADRSRVPGGSSSGAAVAAADGMCEISIGSDTGGSCRAPAAFCGIVGFKPSKYRVPTDGAFPLSYTLDSIGSLSKSVMQCAAVDAVMAGEEPWTVRPVELPGLRFGVLQGLPLANLDATVAARFSDATASLARAGVRLSDENSDLLEAAVRAQSRARISSIEAYSFHRAWLPARAADYDPNVLFRVEQGRDYSAADYVQLMRDRASLIRAMAARMSDLDALILPTTPEVAPSIAEMSAKPPEAFIPKDLFLGRNTVIANFFDLCAISVPLPRQGGLPVGLMLVARNGEDKKLFRVAAAVERLFGG
jgi:aspartyl-tRNA(Asn)/glutamyl-tRNA(Gln) amidotransferase subunit A